MKIWLVFEDWKKNYKSVYERPEGEGLTCGPFHHGTGFQAEIEMKESSEQELKEAIAGGFTPVFAVRLD